LFLRYREGAHGKREKKIGNFPSWKGGPWEGGGRGPLHPPGGPPARGKTIFAHCGNRGGRPSNAHHRTPRGSGPIGSGEAPGASTFGAN